MYFNNFKIVDIKRKFTKEEALSDISKLLKVLVEAPPDPFMNSGSRIKFYMNVDNILNTLPETLNIEQMYIIACKIVALLGDCHTSMDLRFNTGKIWLELEPIDEKLVVIGVYKNELKCLIGQYLLAVNYVPVEELLTKMPEIRAANGIYNNLVHLADAIKNPFTILLLTGNNNGDIKKVTFTFRSMENNSIQKISLFSSKEPPGSLIENNSFKFALSKSDLTYKIIDNMIGYLRIGSMTKYRESYESLLNSGASESLLS